jgi:FixJ family two-component response regulator
LRLRCVPSSAIVRGDPRLLRRILTNLLSNAIKYTDHGKILVGCRRVGTHLRIEVVDTGVGIAPESLHAVFDEFYRVDKLGREQLGLGIGLYIVKRFADLLGYRVEARSILGKGTMFTLVIPNWNSAVRVRSRDGTTKGIAALEPSILLVEDDAAQRQALSLLFEAEGYRTISASAGAEAVALVHERPGDYPQAIVADYNLPGAMTGVELIRRVRDELKAEVPGLILTGQKPAVELPCGEATDLLFVHKPAKPADLLAAVRTLVTRAMPAWASSAEAPRRTVIPLREQALQSEIAIIDDEASIRDALQAVLESDGHTVATYESAEAFLADPAYDRISCLVIDIGLRGMAGLELQQRLKLEGCNPGMIFLTGSADLPLAVRAMREGAADFLQKPVSPDTLLESVGRALEQRTRPGHDPPRRAETAGRLSMLTAREREVLERIVDGQLNKNIAADLGVSERTIEHHRQSIMRKLEVKSVAMLVRLVG